MLNPTNIDLYALIADMKMLFKVPAQSKNLRFILETSSNLPKYVIVDSSKLRRIFINLIGNAIKFTDEGGIAVRTRADKLSEDTYNFIAEIQDSGIGISENEIGKLFNPFEQTTAGINKSSGTGLGLVLSRELSVLMGGNITVISEPGKGSIFTFNVILKAGKLEPEQDILVKRVVAIPQGQKNNRILVADDNKINLHVLVNLLKAVGFETMEALNGEEVISIFETWNPHLILMDMRMPVMDGYETTKRIKATQKGKLVPIIAVTASVFEEDRKKTVEYGMVGCILKPFRENELFGAIGQALGIDYIFEDVKPVHVTQKYLNNVEELVKDIAELPETLIVQMQNALSVADFDILIELVKSIESNNILLSRHLMSYAKDYNYNYLNKILTKGIN